MTRVIRNGIASVIGLIATAVRVVCSIIGALIIVHAAFVLFSANPHNVLVEFTAGIRDSFGWFTKNLFTPKDPKIGQAINDALAGLIWVVLGSLLSKLILRFAPAKKSPDKGSAMKETPRATPVRQTPPSQQPAEEKKPQEAPGQAQPQAQGEARPPAQPPARPPARPQQEAGAVPKVPSPAAAAMLQPEPESESAPEAKHQARATARRENEAEAQA
jgi:hypothetical protein